MRTLKCLTIGLFDLKPVLIYLSEGPTNVAQSHPETLRVNIQQFHRYIRRMAIKTKQDLAGKQDGAIGPLEFERHRQHGSDTTRILL